ncbi:hypothetical protein [Sphingopyxis sp.]|uniref:hypothetical protein n=1 Tax=Sphingopyxis sp. TaxID=1908224 RepID=UPI0025F654D2|nr:hypothetical protein [Sphingopyxis sp.]MBK6414646.1 hypothetical protein [Sphingopyxis sp.]
MADGIEKVPLAVEAPVLISESPRSEGVADDGWADGDARAAVLQLQPPGRQVENQLKLPSAPEAVRGNGGSKSKQVHGSNKRCRVQNIDHLLLSVCRLCVGIERRDIVIGD